MKRVAFVIAASACAFLAAAQNPPAASQPSRNEGVPEEWDVRTLLGSLKTQAQHLKPILDQIHPENWASQGAPPQYATQWKTCQSELTYLLQTTDAFFKQPERLTLALDTYFRMESMDTMLGSLIEGIRKYQNPAVADLVQGIMNENGGNRDRLREYIRQLSVQKEQEFQIADREAQRCRGILNRTTPTTPRKSK